MIGVTYHSESFYALVSKSVHMEHILDTTHVYR